MNTRYSDKRSLPVRILSVIGKVLILGITSMFTAFPFVWMILSMLKTKEEVMNPNSFIPAVPQWSNITRVIFDSNIPKYMWNSTWVAVVIVAIQIVTGAMLAYALVFLKFRTNKILFTIVMATYMLPVAATYIPSYIILADWNMLDSFRGIIISSTVSIFGIFLLRQGFMQIPKGLVEAARMDGASHWRALWGIVCPMTKSSFITFGLMNFISTYNNYMWPSLITKTKDVYLVSQGL
ncbi:MAG: carbohydrate ABC transporter permease, partial [Solobacterium sp.]|nr:carbohydrate ABC transporter permease [Solobacterium sp.]